MQTVSPQPPAAEDFTQSYDYSHIVADTGDSDAPDWVEVSSAGIAMLSSSGYVRVEMLVLSNDSGGAYTFKSGSKGVIHMPPVFFGWEGTFNLDTAEGVLCLTPVTQVPYKEGTTPGRNSLLGNDKSDRSYKISYYRKDAAGESPHGKATRYEVLILSRIMEYGQTEREYTYVRQYFEPR